MLIWGSTQLRILGLKLTDDKGKKILEKVWCKFGGEWVAHEIGEGEEIIGLQCNVKKYNSVISRLGFLLWKSN